MNAQKMICQYIKFCQGIIKYILLLYVYNIFEHVSYFFQDPISFNLNDSIDVDNNSVHNI